MVGNKRILITGATGFIGANLVRKFLKLGREIYIFTRATSNKWRINDVLKDTKEYCVDLLDSERLEKVISEIRPEIILHTAVYGGYPFQKDIKKIIGSNFIGTVNLVNACKKVDFELFVNTGSSSEYGIKSRPMTEEDMLEPVNNYGVSKAAATLYCQAVARREKKSIVTLRIFSPYGYYEEPTRLVPSVIRSCLLGENPKVSSPDFVRDFIFIEDVLDAYMKAIETPNNEGEVFNIGFGKQRFVREVVDEIIKSTGNKVEPKWGAVSNPYIEPKVWQSDITKAKEVLKWQPKHALESGIRKTIEWFEENMRLYNARR